MSTKKIVIVAILVMAAGAAIYGWSEFNRKNEDLSGIKPAYTVEAVQLINEFNQNDSAANARYLGRVVAVSGLVKQVEKDEELILISACFHAASNLFLTDRASSIFCCPTRLL